MAGVDGKPGDLADIARFHRREGMRHLAMATAVENGVYSVFAANPGWLPVSAFTEALGGTDQAANNRLRRLLDAGVIQRRRTGERFEYRWLSLTGASS